ncbi:unnamed protein product [Prorocentrum cordatum]|uniref:Protochlorophyllide reductase n=1 Tax=Prorocentrum cordatum TaxID=2364126 RepID=A0ABN9WB94_9DINO|nr:unnamed protein product [Polarella glacialis]
MWQEWPMAAGVPPARRDGGEGFGRKDTRPNVVTYNALITVCRDQRLWMLALRLLPEMRRRGLDPDIATFGALGSACGSCGEWSWALELLGQMKADELQPNDISYNVTMLACARGNQWTWALGLMDEMRGRELPPSVISYGAALKACAGGEAWTQALGILGEMRSRKVQPNLLVFGVTVASCQVCGRWEHVLSLVREMRSQELEPDDRVLDQGIKEAVEGDSQWDLALELEASRIEKQREAELEREDIDALAELEDVLGVGGGSGGGAGDALGILADDGRAARDLDLGLAVDRASGGRAPCGARGAAMSRGGKVAVVTGSNSGIGKESARQLVARGFHVVLACRSQDKADAAAAEIGVLERVEAKTAMTVMLLDTSKMASVKAFAAAFLAKFDRLDVLVHNAGTGYVVRDLRTTEDGLEAFFQTNYLGPFLLSKLLLEVIKKSSGRVVCVSSIEHWEGSYDFAKATAKTGGQSYPTSKLMLTLHAFELRKRHGVLAVAANPGSPGGRRAGRIALATQRKILKGEPAAISIQSWKSHALKRKCAHQFGAETLAISEGMAMAEFMRTMLLEIVDLFFDLMRPYLLAGRIPVINASDSPRSCDRVARPKQGEYGATSDSIVLRSRYEEQVKRKQKEPNHFARVTDCCFTGLDLHEMDCRAAHNQSNAAEDHNFEPEAVRRFREAQQAFAARSEEQLRLV